MAVTKEGVAEGAEAAAEVADGEEAYMKPIELPQGSNKVYKSACFCVCVCVCLLA